MNILGHLFSLLFPRACQVCGSRLSHGERAVCTRCNLSLPRTGHERHPLDNPVAQVFWHRLPIAAGMACVHHRRHSRAGNLVYQLKYCHNDHVAQWMAATMSHMLRQAGMLQGIDLIVPVPLSRERLGERGYNQAALIGVWLTHYTGIAMREDLVERLSFAGSQTALGTARRSDNVERAFAVTQAGRAALPGLHVLILDDILTTGATACAVGKALVAGGAAKVSVMVWGVAF